MPLPLWARPDTDATVGRVISQYPHSVDRLFSARLAAALLTALSATPLTAFAQTAASPVKPASSQTMEDLVLAAAVSTCALAISEKVPVEKTSVSAARSVVFVVESQHGAQIEDAGKLEPNQIFNVTFANTILSIKRGCYAKLGTADQAFVDKMVVNLEKALKSQPAQKPSSK